MEQPANANAQIRFISMHCKVPFIDLGFDLYKFEGNREINYLFQKPIIMNLGAFSVSLAVKDLNKSKEFYEKLGFTVFAGHAERNYFIMKSGNTLIGLFHNMFPNNIITFNPGWDQSANILEEFDDVRTIQKQLKSEGVKQLNEVDENTTGPGSFMLSDPDGNTILIDQHV